MIKRRKPIRKVSARQAKLNREWQKLKRELLDKYLCCECFGCLKKPTQVHHKRGRGRFLLDKRFLMAVCAPCHDKIHRCPKWATEHGYMISRLAKA